MDTAYVHRAVVDGTVITSEPFDEFDACKADAVATWDMWDGSRGGEVIPNALPGSVLASDDYQCGIFSYGNLMAAVFSSSLPPRQGCGLL